MDCARLVGPVALPPNAKLPGTLMSVLAGLNTAMFAIVAPLMMFEALTGQRLMSKPDEAPVELGPALVGVVLAIVQVALLIAAIQFARLKSKTAGWVASIAAMVPCTGPCCIIGIPLGIWGIMTINKIPHDAWGRS